MADFCMLVVVLPILCVENSFMKMQMLVSGEGSLVLALWDNLSAY